MFVKRMKAVLCIFSHFFLNVRNFYEYGTVFDFLFHNPTKNRKYVSYAINTSLIAIFTSLHAVNLHSKSRPLHRTSILFGNSNRK